MRTDFYYPSVGAGAIHGCRWTPEGEVKAIVQIVHGIGEYVERYDELAEFLTAHGILVVAEDHMGHGKSIGGDGIQGYFSGGWFAAAQDTFHLLTETMAEFPDVPYVLFGHSMGSFLARTILCMHPDSGISAAVIEGTGWQPKAMVALGKFISGTICNLTDEKKPNRILQWLYFGTYNAKIKNPNTKFDWLTRDNAVVAAYTADPLCGYNIASAGLLRDMMDGIDHIQQAKSLDRMEKKLPILFIAGEADPVGNYGKGVVQTAEAFKTAGMKNVTVKLYPDCRHELHNELNRQDVYTDMLQWLKGIAEIV